MRRQWNKCFCIGSYKTGTTSLESVFVQLGFRTLSNSPTTFSATREALKGKYDSLRTIAQNYDYMGDSPFCLGAIYIVLDTLYPRSKFILTIREDESWFKSFRVYHTKRIAASSQKISKQDTLNWNFGYHGFACDILEYEYLNRPDYSAYPPYSKISWELFKDKYSYIDKYRERNSAILNYFVNRPDDLLVLDLSKEQTTHKILNFLNLPLFLESDMPHLNKN